MASTAWRTAVVVGEIECDATGIRLVSAGLRGLHDDRVAEVSGPPRQPTRRRLRPARRRGDPYACRSWRASRGSSRDVLTALERLGDDLRPADRRRRVWGWPRAAGGASRHARRRARAPGRQDSGYANAATRLSPERSASGTPAPAMSTASSGFPDGLGSRDVVDRSATSSATAVTVGTKSVITASTCGSCTNSRRASAYVWAVAPPEHVDRVRETRLGRQERRQRYACLLGQLGQLQACGIAGIGAQNSEPTGIREHGHPASLGLRLTRQQRRDVDQLFERGRTDDSPPGGTAPRRPRRNPPSGRVRRRGTLPDRRRSALQREDRLASRDPPRELSEPSWVPEGLEVEEDDLGCRVVLPPFEKVVRTRRRPCSRSRRTTRARARASPPPRARRSQARRSGTRIRCCRSPRSGRRTWRSGSYPQPLFRDSSGR